MPDCCDFCGLLEKDCQCNFHALDGYGDSRKDMLAEIYDTRECHHFLPEKWDRVDEIVVRSFNEAATDEEVRAMRDEIRAAAEEGDAQYEKMTPEQRSENLRLYLDRFKERPAEPSEGI